MDRSQLSAALCQTVSATKELDITVFFRDMAPLRIMPGCAMMNMLECFGFVGPLFATSLETAEFMIEQPKRGFRAYYMWQLEWLMTRRQKSYERIQRVCNAVPVIARNQDQATLIQSVFNLKELPIVADCSIEGLYHVYRSQS